MGTAWPSPRPRAPHAAGARRGCRLLGALLAAAAGTRSAHGAALPVPDAAADTRLRRAAASAALRRGSSAGLLGSAGAAGPERRGPPERPGSRRSLFSLLGAGVAASACAAFTGARRARAAVDLKDAEGKVKQPTLTRTGAEPGDETDVKTRRLLFSRMLRGLPKGSNCVIVELGMGSFPNSVYLDDVWDTPMDIIGIEPNVSEHQRAMESAEKAGLLQRSNVTIRTVEARAEALPLEDGTADVVLSTYTLCAVDDLARVIAEAKRVLKPGGQFAFLENVLSDDSKLAEQQRKASPDAGGCRYDRPILKIIKAAGFRVVNAGNYEVKSDGLKSPHAVGIALV
uniref:Methyltransferase type 11 domain-containing protein n=1 Tax=Alexandrium monilatum TaxID=311494 RepID=A0A7S4PZD0_9DINO